MANGDEMTAKALGQGIHGLDAGQLRLGWLPIVAPPLPQPQAAGGLVIIDIDPLPSDIATGEPDAR